MARHARPGLQAVSRTAAELIYNGQLARASLNLEAATFEMWRSTVKHWDYVVALDNRPDARAVAVEVHSATSDSEATALVDKKDTAQRALARELRRLDVRGWYWLASGSSGSVRPGSRLYRLLREADIEGPRSGLDLRIASRGTR